LNDFVQACLFCGTLFDSFGHKLLVAGLTVHAAAR
jgi:hypothetical protein